MATQQITKIIVKNLSDGWTLDYLINFLKCVTPISIADFGVQTFKDISHTALVSLEEPLSGEEFNEVSENLTKTPFIKQVLQLEIVCDATTCSILIHLTSASISREQIFSVFSNSLHSGCEKAEVIECEVYPATLIAVVHYSLPIAVNGVIARGNCFLENEKVLKFEPWYEQFHRPLLQQLLTGTRYKKKPPVPPKPKIKPVISVQDEIPKGRRPPDLPKPKIKLITPVQIPSTESEDFLKIEPGCEQFHRLLLQQLLSKARSKTPSPVPPKPKIKPVISVQAEIPKGRGPLVLPKPKTKPVTPVQTPFTESVKVFLKTEPGYEQSHRPVLQQLLTGTRSKTPSPVPSNPKIKPVISVQAEIPKGSGPPVLPKPKTNPITPVQNPFTESEKVFLETEPGYEQFHRPMLQQLLTGTRSKNPSPVLPKPKTKPITPVQTPCTESSIGDLQKQIQELTLENEKLKISKEPEKHMVLVHFPLPSYQLRLLKDSGAWPREGCNVMLLEKEEEAVFTGTEADCEDGKQELLKRVQQLADDIVDLPPSVSKILETAKGRRYVTGMIQGYPGCSVQVCGSHLNCAAFRQQDLNAFKSEFKRNIMNKTCKVPSSLVTSPEFCTLKTRLENEYLVLLTVPVDDCEDVLLDGFGSDVELAVTEVYKFVSENRSDIHHFHIPGIIQAKACKTWFSKELDEVKQLIIRKNGDIKNESTEGGYSLRFKCQQEVFPTVLNKLKAIKDSITFLRTDLNKEFPVLSDRALVINGLHGVTVSVFMSFLDEKLRQKNLKSIGDFTLPQRCLLPQPRLKGFNGNAEYERRKDGDRSPQIFQRGSRGWRNHGGHHNPSHPHSSYPSLPYNVTVGNTNITVKSGDITEEQVDVAMNVVGENLNLNETALGTAFLKKCPWLPQFHGLSPWDPSGFILLEWSLTDLKWHVGFSKVLTYHHEEIKSKTFLQALQECWARRYFGTGGWPLFETPTSGSILPMSTVLHAVLAKMSHDDVKTVVKQLVLQSLTYVCQGGHTSIAFPPFGVCRRFGHGMYTTASAMVEAITEFLQVPPFSLQNIVIVVYDVDVAGKFAQVLKQKVGGVDATTMPAAVMAAAGTSPEPEASAADDDLSERKLDKFEAMVCATKTQDCKEVVKIMLKELNTVFLWHETLKGHDKETFFELGKQAVSKILERASRMHVCISITSKGVRLCGMRNRVHELLSSIHKEMKDHVSQRTHPSSEMCLKLKLPTKTDHMPSYWEKRRGAGSSENTEAPFKLIPVSKVEQAALEQLVQSTWASENAGHGRDAQNLAHKSIKITKLERLENPGLWSDYSHRRERLFDLLVQRCKSSSPAQYTRVEQLTGSRGPVQTTANIPQGSVLRREMYPQLYGVYGQVNEHYLFHGTKQDILKKIYGQGLDFRLASDRTMLGSGVYAAESSTKADQYTDPKHARTSGNQLTMILLRVLLGEPFIHKEPNPKSKFKRPPCMTCGQTECLCPGDRLYDSVIDDVRLFREFVVYDQGVCYPEYFITYQRQ